ncbi:MULTISPECIES: hypothetical protein [Arthrobacter]|uniref:Integral membrane protein n=2 Tax=Arthrobacter TaxID=1663 RepID=A0ABU9KJ52_9MICC|nr:hypothetical protein [Arthrobacter sp. YJM1]MDP5226831.1 hypothetical protein [Arthrobacter sp. YJM1]
MTKDQENPQPAQDAAPRIPAETGRLWLPLMVRALVCLGFGALTIFWGQPSLAVYQGAVLAYLVLLAAVFAWAAQLATPDSRLPLRVAAGAQLLAAVVVLLVNPVTDSGVTMALSAGLALAGAVEVGLSLKRRGSEEARVLGRDRLIAGVIALGTALLLPFFISLGAHALLGVAGGGAVLTGVLWALGALSLRHDVRVQAAAAEA